MDDPSGDQNAYPPALLPLLQTLPDCVAIAKDGHFVWLNDQWVTLTGYSLEELKTRPFAYFVHPADLQKSLAAVARLEAGGTMVHFQNRYSHVDGHYILLEWTARANEDGTILGIARDVTEKHALREEANMRAGLLNMAEEMAGIGTWQLNLKTNEVYWSPQVFKIHLVDPETFSPNLSSNINFYHPDDRETVGTRIAESLRTLEPFRFELRLIRADGQERVVEASGRPQVGPDGPFAVVGVFRDVTEQRAHEKKLTEAHARAMAASEAKSQFLANMSHEIRTPMNGVMGMAELLSGTTLEGEQRDFVTHIQESAKALMDIINDILDLSKIEAGQLQLESTRFSCERLMQDVALTVAGTAENKGVTLIVNVDADLPRTHLGDPVRCRQILMNLVANAIKFTPGGDVELSSFQEGESLVLKVRDTGIGIAKERQESIFAPFTQADDSTTRRFGGTGLGLTICRQIVMGMGGTLELESTLGAGSTFTARLPIPAHEGPIDYLTQAKKRCVVWIQHPLERQLVADTLRDAGHELCAEGEDLDVILQFSTRPQAALCILADTELLSSDIVNRMKFNGHRIVGIAPHFSTRDSFEFSVDAMVRRPLFREAILWSLENRAQSRSSVFPAAEHPASGQNVRQLRVLLAEDNPVNTKVATRVLEKLGHQVTHAENGLEAVSAWKTQKFDVILMDVHMPELDGFEATRQIRALEAGATSTTPIVALTANAMKGDEERCLHAGMDAYLAKPLNTAELKDVLLEVSLLSRNAGAAANETGPSSGETGPSSGETGPSAGQLDPFSDAPLGAKLGR